MSNKLTSLTGFGEGDPKPEKKDAPRRNPFGGGGDWDYGASAARASKDKNNKLYSGGAKSSALNKKMGKKEGMYTSPTGSKHRIGSSKHSYWKDIESRGKQDKKYGAGD